MFGIDRLGQFLNDKTNLVTDIQQESKRVNKLIVETVLKIEEGISHQDIINELQNMVGAYKAEDFQLRIDNYLYLKGELESVELVMSDTLLYF